jgi:NitT/TauT family transport system substrate-binding protein
LATGIASPLVSGCGPSQAATPRTATPVNVAIVDIADAASFFIALHDGFFRQQGLDVHYTKVPQSVVAMPDLLAGRIQVIGAANFVNAFEAQVHGTADIRVVATNGECTPSSDGVLALQGSGIKTAAGLLGKTLATNITNNIQQLLIDRQIQADDLNPSKVHFVEIPFDKMQQALVAHRVDAVNEIQPYLAQIENATGAENILPPCQGSTDNMPLTGDITTAQWASRHHAAALAFQRAIEQGQAVAQTDRPAVEKVLPSFLKVTPAVVATLNLNNFPDTLNPIPIQRVADLMFSAGVIHHPLNVAPLLVH